MARKNSKSTNLNRREKSSDWPFCSLSDWWSSFEPSRYTEPNRFQVHLEIILQKIIKFSGHRRQSETRILRTRNELNSSARRTRFPVNSFCNFCLSSPIWSRASLMFRSSRRAEKYKRTFNWTNYIEMTP